VLAAASVVIESALSLTALERAATAARNAERGPACPLGPAGQGRVGDDLRGELRVTQPEPLGSEGVDERVEIDLFRVHQYLTHPAAAKSKSHPLLAADRTFGDRILLRSEVSDSASGCGQVVVRKAADQSLIGPPPLAPRSRALSARSIRSVGTRLAQT
jgi:hypothetical protein